MRKHLPAVLLVGAATLAVAAPAAAGTTAGSISDFSADASGHVTFTVTAPALPDGAGLDADSARVLVDGHSLPTTATAVGTTRVAAGGTSAMLIIDTSGSMNGSGIAAARAAARQFLRAAPADVRIGLETFSNRAQLVVQPTTNRRELLAALPALHTDGETALYDALRSGDAAMARPGQHRLVVISDGADTVSHASLSSTVAGLARHHVAVEVVGLHTAEADNSTLRRVAAGTGGRFVLAGDGAALAAALRSSARSYATQLTVAATIPTALWGDRRRVSVHVDSSAGPVTATRVATVGSVSTRRSAASPTPRPASKKLLWAGLAAIGGALLLAVLALFGGDEAVKRRARRLLSRYTMSAERPGEGGGEGSSVARAALGVADRVARSQGLHDRLTMRLTRAGVGFTPSEWLLLLLGVAFAAGLLLILFGLPPLAAAVAGIMLGPLLGHLFLGIRASRRRAAFVGALPDTLQLVSGSLSAGYSLAQSLDGVVTEGSQPVAGEFGRALAESRLGVPIERTLEGVADRMDSEDFRWVCLAIQIQHKVGGNLAEVLLTVSQTMRERVQLHRHVRALSAEGRLSAYLLVGLPIVFTLYLATFRPGYLHPLYSTKIGLMMIGLGVVLISVGSVVMKKMVKVEV